MLKIKVTRNISVSLSIRRLVWEQQRFTLQLNSVLNYWVFKRGEVTLIKECVQLEQGWAINLSREPLGEGRV